MNAVTVAYRLQSGWSLVPAALYDAPPPGAVRCRSISLSDGPEIRLLAGRAALELDAWGAPQILGRARRWLIENEYARLQRGVGLVVDWKKVAHDTEPEIERVQKMHVLPETDAVISSDAAENPVEIMSNPMSTERKTPMTSLDIAPGLDLSAADLTGTSISFLGITGSGKTNSIARVLEQLAPFVPFAVIDIAGEYHGLRALGAVTFGAAQSATVDVAVSPMAGSKIADIALRERKSVILDLSRYNPDDDDAEAMTLVEQFLRRLWHIASTVEETDRKPLVIVIEEAHIWLPQSGKSPVKGVLRRIATMGRKLGLSLFISTQRPAAVDKGVLTQTAISFLHHVTADVDRSRYADIVPSRLMPDGVKISDAAFELERGEAFVLHGKSLSRVHINLRRTRHGGHTPGLGDAPVDEPAIDANAIAALRTQFSESTPDDQSADTGEMVALRAENAQLRAEIVAKDAEIAELRARIPLVTPIAIQRMTEEEINALVDDLHAGDGIAFTPPMENTDKTEGPSQPEVPAPDPRITQLEEHLAAARKEIELLNQHLMAASTDKFRTGQQLRVLEKENDALLNRVDHAKRAKAQAIAQAESLAQTAADLKEREMASSVTAASLQKQLAGMEARLAAAQDEIEFDIIINASADDLRIAELAGWAIRHMQFESGQLNVVLRRARQQQPRDRKPRKVAAQPPMQRWQAPAAPASSGALMGTVIMPDEPCRNGHKAPATTVSELFRDNLKRAIAETPLIEYKPLSHYANLTRA